MKTNPEITVEGIYQELQRYVAKKFKIAPELLEKNPTFEQMNADSMTRLEILLHGDDTFGSHVLDDIEEGLLQGEPPKTLHELAVLIAQSVQAPVSHDE